MAGPPKCDAIRIPRTPTRMWPSRHAIVVTGGGVGSGKAKSIVNGPVPGSSSDSRARTIQQPFTGSQKDSSAVSPSSFGRTRTFQWKASWAGSSFVQFTAIAGTVVPFEDSGGPESRETQPTKDEEGETR